MQALLATYEALLAKEAARELLPLEIICLFSERARRAALSVEEARALTGKAEWAVRTRPALTGMRLPDSNGEAACEELNEPAS